MSKSVIDSFLSPGSSTPVINIPGTENVPVAESIEQVLKDYGTDLGDGWYIDSNGDYYHVADTVTQHTQSEYEAIIAAETAEDDAATNPADLVSGNTTTITTKMQNFSSVLSKLDSKFCKGRAVYTMYFKLTSYNDNGGSPITLVDTTSSAWLENNLLSFTHKMNGSGEANTFTLEILFKPDDRNFLSIDALEKRLLSMCAIYKEGDNTALKETEEVYCNCTFQYGYGDDSSLRSPKYYGTIMDYDTKLENGNLRYTITGYCGLYSAKEYRISAKADYLTDASGNTISDPLSYINRIFEIEFPNKEYVVKFINIENKEDVVFPGEDYKQFQQKNIFQVVKDILSGCLTQKQYEAMSKKSGIRKTFLPNQKQIFSYYIDNTPSEDGGKYGTVYIYKLDSLQGEDNEGVTEESIAADCGIDFGWYAPTSGAFNHIVKDWHPQYEGSILLSMAVVHKSGKGKYYTMTDAGNVREVSGFGAARLGIEDNDTNAFILSTIQEYDNWAFRTQYPYKANMTIIGAPCEVPMTGKIKVSARMGRELHHSSGVYIVLGKTDKISSGGFFSELELFKLAKGYNPPYEDSNFYKDDDVDNDGVVDDSDWLRFVEE